MAGKTVMAAGLIVFRRMSNELEYLLLKASYGNFHWSPPKGHVDPGETEMQAALRETEEEAGLTTDQLKIVENFRSELHYPVKGKPKTVVYWLAELKDPNSAVKISNEHTDFTWQRLMEAMEYAQYDDLKAVLKEADTFIRKKLHS